MDAEDQRQPRARIVYLSHGGGPLPLLGDGSHGAMIRFLRQLPARLERPDAIVVISAHWEEEIATLQGAERPGMLYDYNGFPEETYDVSYPAPGNPSLAHRIAQRLQARNIPTRIDPERGFDHGLFVPLMLLFPAADIPSIQLSLLNSLDPGAHIALGQALRGLIHENILFIGSGFSFHNLRAFSLGGGNEPDPENDAFQEWLIETCTNADSQQVREQRLLEWSRAPSARHCHPREEHLLPLHVCMGLAGRPAELIFDDRILGKRAVSFLW